MTASMSPARSSSLPRLATSDDRASLSAYFDIDSKSRAERGTRRRPAAGHRSTLTEGVREAALLALTAALSAGDERQAIAILWELHSDNVFRFCRYVLANDVEAADVTQKVFENAIKDLGRLRSVDRSSSWLIGIARHRCVDHARSVRRAARLIDASTLCEIASPSLIAERAEDPCTIKLLRECIERLDARDQRLIELRFYEGLQFKEIARRLGNTPGALRVRLLRACRRLRAHLTSRLDSSNGQPCASQVPTAQS
jgi:RNA polymerase sigma-70 factor, ECF subfamily